MLINQLELALIHALLGRTTKFQAPKESALKDAILITMLTLTVNVYLQQIVLLHLSNTMEMILPTYALRSAPTTKALLHSYQQKNAYIFVRWELLEIPKLVNALMSVQLGHQPTTAQIFLDYATSNV